MRARFRPWQRLRLTLLTRILCWYFLSLILLAIVLFGFFNLQFRMGPLSPLRGVTEDRMRTVVRLVSHDLGETARADWDGVLARYADAYGVDLFLFSPGGQQLAGEPITLPPSVREHVVRDRPDRRGPGPQPPPPRGPEPRFRVRTSRPTRFWGGMPTPIFTAHDRRPQPATLVAMSTSMSGNGLFYDTTPWMIVIGVVIALSTLLWIPLVRSITLPIGRVTRATERVAQGQFDVRLEERRQDEIGRLGRAINDMATRLSGYVQGQRRFLRDVAHELTSPLARIQLGLGILGQQLEQLDDRHRERLQDVVTDVDQMSELVNELLSYSRAETDPAMVQLQSVRLAGIVRRAVEREDAPGSEIRVAVDEGLAVIADPDLLARALANLLRNAVRYAGAAGPIDVVANRDGATVRVEVRDTGPGVADEAVEQLFEPFFRPEASRNWETGGVGLGLAIVKTCVEACQGRVEARNLRPRGFAVTIELEAAT